MIKQNDSASSEFKYVWFWRESHRCVVNRKGQRCKVTARGTRNSIRVQFEDGFTVITSCFAVRRLRGLE